MKQLLLLIGPHITKIRYFYILNSNDVYHDTTHPAVKTLNATPGPSHHWQFFTFRQRTEVNMRLKPRQDQSPTVHSYPPAYPPAFIIKKQETASRTRTCCLPHPQNWRIGLIICLGEALPDTAALHLSLSEKRRQPQLSRHNHRTEIWSYIWIKLCWITSSLTSRLSQYGTGDSWNFLDKNTEHHWSNQDAVRVNVPPSPTSPLSSTRWN